MIDTKISQETDIETIVHETDLTLEIETEMIEVILETETDQTLNPVTDQILETGEKIPQQLLLMQERRGAIVLPLKQKQLILS